MGGPRRLETIIRRGLVRMSWDKTTVYNLMQRTRMPDNQRSNTFKQTWIAKRETRGYHGEGIREGKFLRSHFDPLIKLPDMHSHPEAIKRLPPIAMLCFAELERRLDIAVFRCHFAQSAVAARGLVAHGHVKVNGKTVQSPSHVLKDGDVISVDPSAVILLRSQEEIDAETPVGKEVQAAVPDAEEEGATTETDAEGPEGTKGQAVENEQSKSEENPTTSDPTLPSKKTRKTFKPPNMALSRRSLRRGTPLVFSPPPYLAPFLFLPEYLEVNYPTLSAVFLRSPTVLPGRCELPTPWPAEHHALAYEWYSRKYRAMKPRRTTEVKELVAGQQVRLKKKHGEIWRHGEEKRQRERERERVEAEVRETEKARTEAAYGGGGWGKGIPVLVDGR
ncbi:mitochondrial 37S ribosomal protein nam9 [Gonapodya sp. JEL0774]|nr:mitochondrial 37S ribosomal protein nam9 [Gonapodya sp. JEL0774]